MKLCDLLLYAAIHVEKHPSAAPTATRYLQPERRQDISVSYSGHIIIQDRGLNWLTVYWGYYMLQPAFYPGGMDRGLLVTADGVLQDEFEKTEGSSI